ncbi:MAG: DUF4312 family protein [Psychrilyobacter sp.]|uniref:DUF4312 family protein n=1 Tax=Psychrilyobacter sp. TaxID=2586924 RepID=UPI003C786BF7
MKSSDLKKEIKRLIISGKGKTEQEAIANCFSSFRKEVEKDINGVIIKLDPIEVYILDKEKKIEIKKFFEFFWAKEITSYVVKIEIEFEVKYI